MIHKMFERHLDLEDFLPDSKSLLLDYICKLCGGVLHEASFDGCGHMFCSKCLKKAIEMKHQCPISNKSLILSNIPTSFLIKIIEKRDIYCKNRKNDCEWSGKYPLYEDHIKNDCKKQIIQCTNDVCVQKFLKEELDNHLKVCEYRLVACINCEILVSNILITCHINVCPKVKLNCPLNCGVTIERKELEEHSKLFCDNATMQCTYYNYGCEYRGPKKSLGQHSSNAIAEHSHLIIRFLDGFNKNFNERIILLQNNIYSILNDDQTEDKNVDDQREVDQDTNKHSLKLKRNRNEVEEEKTIYNDKEQLDKAVAYISTECRAYSNDLIGNDNSQNLWEFNKCFSSSALILDKNKVTCVSSGKNHHMFAFVDTEINQKNSSWKINVIKYSIWIGLGVCDRSKIISNKYIFTNPINPTFNHGCFILSSNHYLWNANNINENNKAMRKTRIEQGEVVTISYNKSNYELTFYLEIADTSYKLTNVKTNNALVPCVILLSNGDEISLDLIKNN